MSLADVLREQMLPISQKRRRRIIPTPEQCALSQRLDEIEARAERNRNGASEGQKERP